MSIESNLDKSVHVWRGLRISGSGMLTSVVSVVPGLPRFEVIDWLLLLSTVIRVGNSRGECILIWAGLCERVVVFGMGRGIGSDRAF